MLLILILDKTFHLFYLKDIITFDKILLKGKKYTKDILSKENEGFIGFFDWLRVEDGKIAGIRICYFEDLAYGSILSSKSYVNSVNGGLCQEILFSKKNDYKDELSGDQDFTNNYIYKSVNEEYLLTFGLDHLAKNELQSLLEYCEIIEVKDIS